jgi:hypothetical protein
MSEAKQILRASGAQDDNSAPRLEEENQDWERSCLCNRRQVSGGHALSFLSFLNKTSAAVILSEARAARVAKSLP